MTVSDDDVIAGTALAVGAPGDPLKLLIEDTLLRHQLKGSGAQKTAEAIIGMLTIEGFVVLLPPRLRGYRIPHSGTVT